jgi:hypothetical protein
MEILFLLFLLVPFLIGAVTQNPITGRTKNAYGPAIFSKWKDKNTMRTKPVSVANPNTIPQQNARAKMSFLSKLMVQMGAWFDYGFPTFIGSMTRRNAFVKLQYEFLAAAAGAVTSFSLNRSVARTGRNPQTGDNIQIAVKTTVALQGDVASNYPIDEGFSKVDMFAFNKTKNELYGLELDLTISPDDTVTINPLPDTNPQVGDIVEFVYSFRNPATSEVVRSQGEQVVLE